MYEFWFFEFSRFRVDTTGPIFDRLPIPQFWTKRPPLLHGRSWYMYVWLYLKETGWGSPKGVFHGSEDYTPSCGTQVINMPWLIGLNKSMKFVEQYCNNKGIRQSVLSLNMHLPKHVLSGCGWKTCMHSLICSIKSS